MTSALPTRPSRGSALKGAFDWWLRGARALRADAQRRWYVYTTVFAIWALAVVRAFVYHAPVVPLLFNVTGSLPYHVAYVDYSPGALARGDFIIYAFSGQASERDYPGLKGQPFFKKVAGVAGDTVSVADRNVFVNGNFVGVAKTHTFDKRPLHPITAGVIPSGHLYAQGTGDDSFDSRYTSSGLVAMSAVIAIVHPIF